MGVDIKCRCADFENLNKQLQKAHTIVVKEGIPVFYFKVGCECDTLESHCIVLTGIVATGRFPGQDCRQQGSQEEDEQHQCEVIEYHEAEIAKAQRSVR